MSIYLRIIVALLLAFQWQVWDSLTPEPAFATSPTADVTVTYRPDNGVAAPTDLVLVRIDSSTVQATWVKNGSANYTTLAVDAEEYPVTYNATAPAYFGTATSANISWPSDILELYVSAWGYDEAVPGYSLGYATADIGGDFLDGISVALTYFIVLIFCIAMTVITLWKVNVPVAFLTLAAWLGMMAYHLSVNDQLSGITQGGTADVILIQLYWVVGVAIFLVTVQRVRGRFSGSWDDDVSDDGSARLFRGRRKQPLDSVEQYRRDARAAVRKNRSR